MSMAARQDRVLPWRRDSVCMRLINTESKKLDAGIYVPYDSTHTKFTTWAEPKDHVWDAFFGGETLRKRSDDL